MNRRFSLLLLCVCGGIILGAGSLNPARAEAFTIQKCLPVVDTSLDNLDARDSLNRPINTIAAENVLKSIFLSNLYDLLVVRELHSIAEALSILQKQLNLDGRWFSKRFPIFRPLLLSVIISKSRNIFGETPCILPWINLLVVSLSLLVVPSVVSATKNHFVLLC